MAVRSWLIRGIILAGVAAVATFAWMANSYVSPDRVREKVLAHLNEQFDGVDIRIGSARMQILGGIAVTDMTLTRRTDPTGQPFLVVPHAILTHDKESLNHGRLVIKKVEFKDPILRIERGSDGRWDAMDVIRPGPADKPLPTFVATGAKITIIDHSPGGLPPIALTDARFTILTDTVSTLTVHEARATAAGFGQVKVNGWLNRVTNQLAVKVELPEFPLGEAASAITSRYAPALVPHLNRLKATAGITADLTYTPGTTPAWRHDIEVKIDNGRFEHPDLPWVVEQIAIKARSQDGRIKVENASAKLGPMKVKASFETRMSDAIGDGLPDPLRKAGTGANAPSDDLLGMLEDNLRRAEISVSGLPLDDTLFNMLPPAALKARKLFSPVGAVDIGYRFAREGMGWKRELDLMPQRLAIKYEKFPYPVTDLRGRARRTCTQSGSQETVVDLFGTAGGQTVTIKGQLIGPGDDPAINLRISGTNVPLDEHLIAALPGQYPALVKQFRASGRGDFVAEIVQEAGCNLCRNEFRIDIRDGTANWTRFPYPLRNVKGRLVARVEATDRTRPVRPNEPLVPLPDRDELILDGFSAVHVQAPGPGHEKGQGVVEVYGSKRPIPGTHDRKLTLHMSGNACAVDADLKSALGALSLAPIWTTLSPSGNLTFSADLEVQDRGHPPGKPELEPAFNPATDLKLALNFSGPAVTPSFFPYPLTDLSGWLQYKNGRVGLAQVAAWHDRTRVGLAAGDVRFYPDGMVWAKLTNLEVKPLIADAAFLSSMPPRLRAGFEDLKLSGRADLTVKDLVVLTPPDSPKPSAAAAPPAARESTPPTPIVPAAGTDGRPQTPAWLTPPPLEAPPAPPDPVVFWDLEMKLAGAGVDTGVPWEEMFGGVACRGIYEGTHLGIVRGNAWLDRAIIARQPVTRAGFHLACPAQRPDPNRPGGYLPARLEFTNLTADLFQGRLGGEAWVELGQTTRYGVWLTAADVKLEELARNYKLGADADLKGIAQAQLLVYNQIDPLTGKMVIEGSGKVDVPAGRMYNLPVLLDLTKMLKLQAPDKTAFEEAHAAFRIVGDRVKVDQLDMIGKAVCLGGAGEVDTTGEFVKFEFYTLGSQILAKLVNTPVGDLSAFMSRNFFLKIKLTRENGELKYRTEPVPVVSEPAKAVLERMKTGVGRLAGK